MSKFDASIRTNVLGFRRDISAPCVKPPAGSCDTHMHIVGPFNKYPLRDTRSLNPVEGTLEDYRRVRKTLGLDRTVVVQPSVFVNDNACTLDAVDALNAVEGSESARAVVVVDVSITEAELAAMHARGARGVRVQQVVAGGASVDDMEEIAAKIRPLGWHMQLFMDCKNIPELAQRLRKLPVDVVFDHMTHVDEATSIDHEGFNVLQDLMQAGRTWVKLSNAFWWPDAERARRLIAANQERVLWGTDWPHLGFRTNPPDDGSLLDVVSQWTDSDQVMHRLLVDNPSALYFY